MYFRPIFDLFYPQCPKPTIFDLFLTYLLFSGFGALYEVFSFLNIGSESPAASLPPKFPGYGFTGLVPFFSQKRPFVSRQFLTRNYPRPNRLLKCLQNCLSPTREGIFSSFKITPAVRAIARQMGDKK